jgi:hypothetical protein
MAIHRKRLTIDDSRAGNRPLACPAVIDSRYRISTGWKPVCRDRPEARLPVLLRRHKLTFKCRICNI